MMTTIGGGNALRSRALARVHLGSGESVAADELGGFESGKKIALL